MNRVSPQLGTPAVSLAHFDHPPGLEHCDPDHEVAAADSISFVQAGEFDMIVGGRRWRFLPGMMFVATRGMQFACRHEKGRTDDLCLSVAFGEQAVEDLRSAGIPPLVAPAAHLTRRARYLRHRLASCERGDEIRLELLSAALYESLAAGDQGTPRRHEPGATAVMRRIDRAVERIEQDYARPLSLDHLASTAGMSSFHFARVFRELVGMPPHRYLTAVRLRHAVARLEQGATVSATALDVGFGSLGHFITAFRKRFGVVPSAARRGVRLPSMRAAVSAPIWGLVESERR